MSNKCICDNCGQEKFCAPNKSLPGKWITLRLSVTGENHYNYQAGAPRDICDDCIHKFKLQPAPDEKLKDAADKLWDLFVELAEEARDEVS